MADVAAIICAHNAAEWLDDSIQSVLNQSVLPRELVIFDDASTDATRDILSSYETHPLVRCIYSDVNIGQGAGRNIAAKTSKASLLAFLDADDVWAACHLAVLTRLADHTPQAGVFYGRMGVLGSDQLRSMQIECSEHPRRVIAELMRDNDILPSSMMIRRTLFEEVGGFAERAQGRFPQRDLAEDHWLLLQAASRSMFRSSSEVTVFYRQHNEQESLQAWEDLFINSLGYRLRVFDELSRTNGDVKELSRCRSMIRMSYEKELQSCWDQCRMRDMRRLLMMCGGYRILSRVSLLYVGRAFCPLYLKGLVRHYRRQCFEKQSAVRD